MYFYGYRQHQPHAFVNKLINIKTAHDIAQNGVVYWHIIGHKANSLIVTIYFL